jgi:endonuclease/exonuclease/phosphatase family metal-dependent hydrolase
MNNQVRRFTEVIEAALAGWIFLQSLRLLIGFLYSQIASASLVISYIPGSYDPATPGVVNPAKLQQDIIILGIVIALPIISVLIGRLRITSIIAVSMIIFGRLALNLIPIGISETAATGLVIGGGLLYLAVIVDQRARLFPYFFVLGLTIDQLIRAAGNTLDPTIWVPTTFRWDYVAFGAVIALGILAIFHFLTRPTTSEERQRDGTNLNLNRGVLSIWGAVGMGGFLYLELALLGTPNAIAARTGIAYTFVVPLLLTATILPIIPFVRTSIRAMIAPFDPATRGWIWFIFLALLIVIGTRIQSITIPGIGALPVGGVTLIIAQFMTGVSWWWYVRPAASADRNWGGFWLLLTLVLFSLFAIGDIFTYEYAYVRNFAPPLDMLNPTVPAILRGFRGLGLGLLLLATFIAITPMIQAGTRIPLTLGKRAETLGTLLLAVVFVTAGTLLARPPLVSATIGVPTLRIGTYNLHSGYNEFFHYSLEEIAATIQQSGASVVLLQEVEAGRLTSFGVDQTLWLARRLGMDRRFYPTNEGLQGLAILSRVPIVYADGILLPSVDLQTGLQRVQIQPDPDFNSVITIYNTWLGLLLQGPGLEDLEANQRLQLETILATINTHRLNDYGGQLGRTVLGGTFHNSPGSPLLQELTATSFLDPFAGLPIELSATLRRSNLQPARYDYLWLWSQTLPPLGTNVMPGTGSDHRLAVVEVELRRDN